MPVFSGFSSKKTRLTPLPAAFFTDLLPEIDHLGELKITLFAFWLLDHQEGKIRYFTLKDCLEDSRLVASFGRSEEKARAAILDGLERAVLRSTLLKVQPKDEGVEEAAFFLNSPRGRAAVEALKKGEWSLGDRDYAEAALDLERPNIFKLYEENIGPLTPLLVESLTEAEKEYPQEWIEEAVRAAVENNARSWRYVEAILRRRKEKGSHAPDRRNAEENRRGYIEGEFADFIEH